MQQPIRKGTASAVRRTAAHITLTLIVLSTAMSAIPSQTSASATASSPPGPPVLAISGLDRRPGISVMTTSGKLLPGRTIRGVSGAFAISPDGGQIAYESDGIDSFAVAVRPINAGPPTATIPRADDPAWSADGQELAVDGYGRGAPHWTSNIFTVRPGQPKHLFYRDRAWDTNPTWSPDGASIAFERDLGDGTRSAHGRNGVFVTDGNTRRLLISDQHGSASDPAWSPDGREIAFDDTMHGASDGEGGQTSDIFLINADGTNLRQITFDPRRDDFAPHWSPDGQELGFTVTTPGSERSAVALKVIGARKPKCVLHPSWAFEWPTAWLPGGEPTPAPANCAATVLPPRPQPIFGCTRAAAQSAVDRSTLPLYVKQFAHPGDWGIVKHCVDFTRDGRQDIVVVFNGGGSGANIAWAAFRRTPHDWKRVFFAQGDRLTMSVVGHDLLETYPVYRPNDCHCDPTGGVAHREYGWNGHRLVLVARWHTAS